MNLYPALFFCKIGIERLTPLPDIGVGGFKVTCVPRICNRPRAPGKIQKLINFLLSILPDNPKHIPYVRLIHPDQIVIFLIVGARHLHRPVPLAVNPVLLQNPPRPPVNAIPDLLRAGRRRCNHKLIRPPLPRNQLLHHKLRHGRAADVAVADKEHAYTHVFFS